MGERDELRRGPVLIFSALVIAATLWPLREPEHDSFPLSSYPMFSGVRDKPWIDVMVGFTADGDERRIRPGLIANREVMQAAQTVSQAIRRRRAKQLCEQVAARIGQSSELTDVVRLEVQSRQFDPRTYFTSEAGKKPLRTRRRAKCEVSR